MERQREKNQDVCLVTADSASTERSRQMSSEEAMKNTTATAEHVTLRAPIYWSHEAITYLGLDRLGLARPDMALQRLIKKGALRLKKIGGLLVFDKQDLDRLVEKGDEVRRRGRPRKDR